MHEHNVQLSTEQSSVLKGTLQSVGSPALFLVRTQDKSLLLVVDWKMGLPKEPGLRCDHNVAKPHNCIAGPYPLGPGDYMRISAFISNVVSSLNS